MLLVIEKLQDTPLFSAFLIHLFLTGCCFFKKREKDRCALVIRTCLHEKNTLALNPIIPCSLAHTFLPDNLYLGIADSG
jgi:hypothetical protein